MELKQFADWISKIPFGKRLPAALYISRPSDWSIIPPELAATIELLSLHYYLWEKNQRFFTTDFAMG